MSRIKTILFTSCQVLKSCYPYLARRKILLYTF